MSVQPQPFLFKSPASRSSTGLITSCLFNHYISNYFQSASLISPYHDDYTAAVWFSDIISASDIWPTMPLMMLSAPKTSNYSSRLSIHTTRFTCHTHQFHDFFELVLSECKLRMLLLITYGANICCRILHVDPVYFFNAFISVVCWLRRLQNANLRITSGSFKYLLSVPCSHWQSGSLICICEWPWILHP